MFAFGLADRWGMPVRELLSRVDSRELTRWMAYERVRPAERAEVRNAELMHWLGCLWSNKPPALAFFLPRRGRAAEPEQQSPQQIRSRLGSLLGRV